jgi:hypothetical protein
MSLRELEQRAHKTNRTSFANLLVFKNQMSSGMYKGALHRIIQKKWNDGQRAAWRRRQSQMLARRPKIAKSLSVRQLNGA